VPFTDKDGSKRKNKIVCYQHFIYQLPYKGNMFAENPGSRPRKLGIPRRNMKIPLLQAMSMTLMVTDKLETFISFFLIRSKITEYADRISHRYTYVIRTQKWWMETLQADVQWFFFVHLKVPPPGQSSLPQDDNGFWKGDSHLSCQKNLLLLRKLLRFIITAWILLWMRFIWSKLSDLISLRTMQILTSHLRPCLPRGLFPSIVQNVIIINCSRD